MKSRAITISIAVLIIIAVVASAILGLYIYIESQTPGTVNINTSGKATAEDTNSSLGVTLVLTLSTATNGSSDIVIIDASENNSLDTANNVTSSNSWPLNGLTLGGCGTLNYPMGIEIFKGNYDQNNLSLLSNEKSLLFYHPGPYNCPAMFEVKNYRFQASGDTALLGIGPGLANASGPVNTFGPLAMTNGFPVSGSWSSGNSFTGAGPSFHYFAKGIYTVVAGDEWGDGAILHFTVS